MSERTDKERLDFYELIRGGKRAVFANSPCGIMSAAMGCDEKFSHPTIRAAIDAHMDYNERHGVTPESLTLGVFDP